MSQCYVRNLNLGVGLIGAFLFKVKSFFFFISALIWILDIHVSCYRLFWNFWIGFILNHSFTWNIVNVGTLYLSYCTSTYIIAVILSVTSTVVIFIAHVSCVVSCRFYYLFWEHAEYYHDSSIHIPRSYGFRKLLFVLGRQFVVTLSQWHCRWRLYDLGSSTWGYRSKYIAYDYHLGIADLAILGSHK